MNPLSERAVAELYISHQVRCVPGRALTPELIEEAVQQLMETRARRYHDNAPAVPGPIPEIPEPPIQHHYHRA